MDTLSNKGTLNTLSLWTELVYSINLTEKSSPVGVNPAHLMAILTMPENNEFGLLSEKR
jgi:hypothetical protein